MKTNPTRTPAKARRGREAANRSTPLQKGCSKATAYRPVAGPLRIRSILVPIDFSAPSKKAFNYAVPFAEQFGAKLTLLHVVEPVPMTDFWRTYPVSIENDKLMATSKAQLELLMKQEAIDPRIVEQALVRQGRSFYEITDAARMLKVDLIIISTHGYTGFKHALLGSTTERVVRHAPCPVLVVREREHEFLVS
ncbi:MAG: universal stress protein [Verrucomicrobiales bacterium]|nr:universal stress protein [Verrucomicrobiales bacterium]